MHEPTLNLSNVVWSRQKEIVRVFYKEMWDHANVSLVPQLFHPDFTFRGSLGPQLVGHQQFIGYVEFVTGALGQYTSDILALGEECNQVFGKLRFHGFHRRELFGIKPTGRHVWWYGTPIFTFEGERVRDLWVLGDIHGLTARLHGEGANTQEVADINRS
ncbi:MAG: ester cyclase [Vicinamibacterales bacterium]